ncbi:hypothetical protein PoB_000805300 [Plakobranchus ocellatus]|uniref:Uncharacterized protein n=1 Tax=Plakobranchus ocellatus TaxID=259542 RepID=A0AAV3YHD2_9GAST|nr:hypothetical protein PoB_000805300 [Plakobranchus ocellatus]
MCETLNISVRPVGMGDHASDILISRTGMGDHARDILGSPSGFARLASEILVSPLGEGDPARNILFSPAGDASRPSKFTFPSSPIAAMGLMDLGLAHNYLVAQGKQQEKTIVNIVSY